MTGESGVRRAEDVGGQELSYAEVKAIASGNPAVLTLAEADAELQRLGVLKRNHADEQYLARRNLRELPQTIERVGKRLAALTTDAATIRDNDGLTVGGKPGDEKVLGNALDRLPDQVDRRRQFPVGKFRGLTFGIERHPGGHADVYLEGEGYRSAQLWRDSQGPRAVMNALNRLATSYDEQIAAAGKDLTLARSQFADFEARLGKPFKHTAYTEELTGLRDRLKTALSGTPADGEPTTGELAEQIKALKAAHVIEAAPARVRAAKPEQPRKVEGVKPEEVKPEETSAPEQAPESLPEETPEEVKPTEEAPPKADDDAPPVLFQQRVKKSVQLSLF